jgi:HSP20 family protein
MNTTCCEPSKTVAKSPSARTERVLKPVYSVDSAEHAYEVRVELPGVPKGGVRVDLHENVLFIRGERRVKAPDSWRPLHRELPELDFRLRLRLNAPVDEDQMKASLEDGVLTLQLPIREAAKPRQIEIE